LCGGGTKSARWIAWSGKFLRFIYDDAQFHPDRWNLCSIHLIALFAERSGARLFNVTARGRQTIKASFMRRRLRFGEPIGICAMRLRTVLLCAASLAFASAPVLGKSTAPAHKVQAHKTAIHKSQPKRRAALPAGVSVVMDEARVVTFNRPVSTVFVGNPLIADATVIDPYHAFVLGKTFGVTNLIALSSQSQMISNQQITVANRAGGVVTLNKGANQFNFSCTVAHCESNPRPGDEKNFFDNTENSIGTHQDQSLKAANVASAR
jgi:hypothetical protein